MVNFNTELSQCQSLKPFKHQGKTVAIMQPSPCFFVLVFFLLEGGGSYHSVDLYGYLLWCKCRSDSLSQRFRLNLYINDKIICIYYLNSNIVIEHDINYTKNIKYTPCIVICYISCMATTQVEFCPPYLLTLIRIFWRANEISRSDPELNLGIPTPFT